MPQVKTIGYEGADLEDFLQTLERENVDILVDVRALAASRRKGFSKTALSSALSARDIGYAHLRFLGDPKEGRLAARAGFMSSFRRIYAAQLATTEAQDALMALSLMAGSQTVCLLCYEADATQCHRTLIVEALNDVMPVEVDHLQVSRGGSRVQRAGRNLSEGRAAA